jgi:hypothetical protein
LFVCSTGSLPGYSSCYQKQKIKAVRTRAVSAGDSCGTIQGTEDRTGDYE